MGLQSRTRLKQLSTQTEAQSKHSVKAGYYYSESCRHPRGCFLLVPATHWAADESIAVPSEEQSLGFEEETGHPFPRGQRDLP